MGLVPLFACADTLVRLMGVSFSFQLLKFFLFILPLVCVFAVPLATCLSVQLTVGNLFIGNEVLLLHFLLRARKSIGRAVGIFAIVLTLLYIPLVFEWAPNSYWNGKSFLLSIAQKQVEQMQPGVFHQLGSKASIFFKNKTKNAFSEMIISFREQQTPYTICAQMGELENGILVLTNGAMHSWSGKREYQAQFETMELALEKIFLKNDGGSVQKPTKFFTYSELMAAQDEPAFKEWHKRIVQILWQFLLPFLSLWAMLVFAQAKSNILLSIILSGFLFLFSYISLNSAYFMLYKSWWAISLFYSIPGVITIPSYILYKKRWK